MFCSWKECKRTLRSERKRTGWPALIFLHLIDKKHEFFSKKLCYWHGLGLWTTINKSTFILQVRLQGVVYGNTQWWDSGLPALSWSKDQPAWCGSGTGTKRCLWSCCPVRPGSWQQNFLWQLVHQLRSPRPYGRKGVGSPRYVITYRYSHKIKIQNSKIQKNLKKPGQISKK